MRVEERGSRERDDGNLHVVSSEITRTASRRYTREIPPRPPRSATTALAPPVSHTSPRVNRTAPPVSTRFVGTIVVRR
ncbi:hypothetical protein BRC90_04840 [Halobacteriales archaeon QS_4_69_34]|nr:MAG: hypothetical protein BRC90_04840 [Halobacteriales archaeon QS_4_69_34]